MSRRLAALTVVLGVVTLVWWVWPSAEREVKARIDALARALNSQPGESDLERMTRAATLTSSLAPDVTIHLDDGRRIDGRDHVLAYARQVLLTQSSLQVDARDVQVHVDPSGSSASATLVVVVNAETFHDVQLDVVRQDHVWLVRDARVVRPVSRPALSQ